MREVIDLAPAISRGLATEPLLADAGAAVAEKLGAEAATLTHGFAGAVLLAAMAVRPKGRPIAFLAAHDIEIAGPLRDLLPLADAVTCPVGSVDRASRDDVEAALTNETAAALYVADDRLAAAPLIGLPDFRHAAHQRSVPTLVLASGGAAAEALLDAGADLLVLDAATTFAGPPLGIVAGRADLVANAAAAQSSGSGRLTLPAPDHLAALLAALAADADEGTARLQERRSELAERLAGQPGLRLQPTATGLTLELDPQTAGYTARDLAHALASGSPALLTDDRDSAAGRLTLDLARLDARQFATVLDTLARTLAQPIPPAPWP
jgi:L-seryl-tRNA(Ser) seleniumtransferase